MAFQEVTPKDSVAWKPAEAGDEIIGKLTNKETAVGPNNSCLYSIEGEDGEVQKVWGSATLDRRMQDVEVGANVKIVFDGTQTNPANNRTYKLYRVLVDL